MLESILKVIGWVFVLTPVTIFLVISIQMVRGVMKDDPFIKAVVLLGIGLFCIGAILLLLLYLTNFLDRSFIR